MPVTTHDSGTPAQEFASADSTVPRYVAAALLGTGATGITQGVEFGQEEQISFIGRQPKLTFPSGMRYAKFISRVNAILADYPAFRSGDNLSFVDDGHPSVIAVFRSDTGMKVSGFLVVCNFDIHIPQHIVVDLLPFLRSDGPFRCTELLSGENQLLPMARLELMLPPCSSQVLKFYRNTEKDIAG
jgi:hypothetical protein